VAVHSSWGKYADLVGGKDEAEQAMTWNNAIVIENKEASVDGTMRTLVLSVTDEQMMSLQRSNRSRRDARWLDGFTNPGQQVAVKCQGGGEGEPQGVADMLFTLSSSPYETRMSSAALDAAIVEILVNRNDSSPWQERMSHFKPGTEIQVSNVIGTGYSSLFDSSLDLQSTLKMGKPLILVSVGPQGLAAARSAMAWTPVQAHASSNKMALIAQIENQTSAPFLVEYDDWREAGSVVKTIACSSSDSFEMEELIKLALFSEEVGIRGVARDAVVGLSGVPGGLAAHLIKTLTRIGFSGSNLLLADFL